MSRIASTGVIALKFVPTIGSKTAPTVAEIAAGTDLTALLTRDGLTTPSDGSTIDVAGANDRYNATASGSYGGQPITAKFFRDTVTGTDTAWTTLPRQTTGYLVIRRFGGSTNSSGDAFAAAQKVEVWPIDVLSRTMLPIADNEAQKFEVQCAVPSAPEQNATVAA
jgi:hypothetical protein